MKLPDTRYGAYVRDAEGNKLCVACHAAPASAN